MKDTIPGSATANLVSVVIPTFNCKEIVRDCFESVKNQTYAPIEVIVIDSCSTDGTRELAAEYGTVYAFGNNKAHTTIDSVPLKRNFGASKAAGEYIYWFDSDMRMKPGTVQCCVDTIIETNADAIIVPEQSYGEGFWAQCRRLEKDCYNQSARSLTDAARFLRKTVWDALGGVDTSLGGNYDYDLQLRLNDASFKTVKLDDFIFHYEGRLQIGKHLRKKFIYGTSAMRYFKKYRNRKQLLTKQFAVVRSDFLANGSSLIENPLTSIGMILMKVMEYCAALCGLFYAELRPSRIPSYIDENRAPLDS